MKPKFEKIVSRKHSLLTDDILARAWNNKALFRNIVGVEDYVKNLEIINGSFYLDFYWMDVIIKKYQDKKPEFFLGFAKRGVAQGEKLKKFARSLKIENKKIDILEKYFWQSVKLLQNLLVFLPQTHPLAKAVENKVVEILKSKGVKEKDLNEILLKISYPNKFNGPVLEKIDLQKIKGKLFKKEKINLDLAIKKHAEKYSYLGYREPFSHGFTVDFFRDRLGELSVDKDVVQKPEKIDIKFNASEKKVIDTLKEMVYFRNYRTEKLYEALFYLEPLWIKIAEFFDLENNHDLTCYKLQEVERLFSEFRKINNNEIKKRRSGQSTLLHNDKIKHIFGIIKEKKSGFKNDEAIKEIRGTVACPGIVRGPVKLVLNSKEQSKVKVGDILVTSMTTPDFMFCMKSAVGFITDEGGVTCHAAIVAREMKKPCIIGTKIATKVLHDGDMIEVNANIGVVKIL